MNRVKSLDVFRLLAIISVISIHTTPFYHDKSNMLYNYLCVLLNQGARWAVPFFFVISGYFFANNIKKDKLATATTIKMLKRLGLIWCFFSVIYLLPYDLFTAFGYGLFGPFKVTYLKLLKITNDPILFIFQGSKVHLWFIVSLACSLVITAIFIRCLPSKWISALIVFSLVLYIFGVLAKSYSETPIGVHIGFNTRNGPFFSTAFFVMGYCLSYMKFAAKHFFYGLLLTLFGYALHFTEIYYLYYEYHVGPNSHDYVIGTLFLGLGTSLMALSNPSFLNIDSLSRVGRYTLGIYAIHHVFVDIFEYLDSRLTNPFWELGYVFIVLFLSITTTLILSKFKRLEKMFL